MSNNRTIDVWSLNINYALNNLQSYFNILSCDEKVRSKRFRFDKDRNKYIISRGFLRSILSNYLDGNPSSLHFEFGSFGKPYLSDPQVDLRFNLSHSGNYVLVAVNIGEEVGIDIELIKNINEIEELAHTLYTAREISELLKSDDFLKSFFKIWTRKESVIKAIGRGLSIPLNTFNVLDSDNILIPDYPDIAERENKKCSIYEIKIADYYSASLASFGETKIINYMNELLTFKL